MNRISSSGVKAAFRTATFSAGVLALAAGTAFAQAGGTFKIGVTTDMSSAYADLSGKGSVIAVQMAVEDFGGTVLGKKIEVVSADHQMKPSVGSTLVTEWFDRDGVSAVFGLAGSSVALAAQAIAKDRPKRAIINTTALTSDLAGKLCLPNTVHWAPDSYALAVAVTNYLTQKGTKNWYLMVQDTAAGPPALAAAGNSIKAMKGNVVGELRVPFNAGDVSSYVLQVQAAKPQMLAIGFGGADLVNIMKAGQQFGMQQSGVGVAALALFGPDIEAMGLPLAQGITAVMPFYNEINDEAKAWAKKFQERHGKVPGWGHIADYEGALNYLKAVQKLGTDDATLVVAEMKKQTYNSFSLDNARIREDGQLVRPMYLFKVKSPAQSKGAGDYYDIIGKVPADDAYSPLSESACPLVKKS